MSENPVLWAPSAEKQRSSHMHRFMSARSFDNFDELYSWSISDPAAFWEALVDYCGVDFSTAPEVTLARESDIMDAGWFSGSTLNFAAHLLRHGGARAAMVFCGEDGRRRETSFDEMRLSVAAVAAGLRNAGVVKGDRVGGYLPNCPEAVIAMLAATSIGAIWSSCSPDFGVSGVVDRFGQIAPKVLFVPNGYLYNGKQIDCIGTSAKIAAAMPSVAVTVVVPFLNIESDISQIATGIHWDEFAVAGSELNFEMVEFDHPLFVMFSSGTTGVPKCIVHGHGGTLIQHLKEHVLHCDHDEKDRLFYFTTCGWMMWNWLVSGLAAGTTLILFDGSPFFDDGRGLWKMAERERVTVFGTSAKYISALEKAGVRPVDEFELPELRAVLSTGSPLAPESFDYVYDAIGKNLQLASIAGGTDILSCFITGNPLLPVRRGELQCRGLAMAVEIYNEAGYPVVEERGELVCTKPFPSAPVGFWNDADNSRYRAAYFDRFPGVWAHGDFAELRRTGGMIIHGRSDAVLNPGGVRIGTAEIYRQVEKLNDVIECIAIGQQWEDDVRVVLFVVLRDGLDLDDAFQARIRKVIRENTTPRHVPAKIIAVPEIPRTRSGKIVEIAVRSVVHGDDVKNTEALANPDALAHFRDIAELSTA
jgi:acetoacetyl-CoA synthetase